MLTQRLGSATQKDPAFINKLLAVIQNNPKSCDEVWFASDYGFPPLSVHRKTAETIMEQAKKFREAGIRVSLQISNTLGHGEYMKSTDCSGLLYEDSPVEHLVGFDGTVAGYCFCLNGAHFRRYVAEELKTYARIHPHTVWFDDDLRPVNHNPVNFGCFCETCIAKFNARHQTAFTREELVNAINYGDFKFREMFVSFERDCYYELARFFAKTVHDISTETYMGYQYYCNGGYLGFNFDYIFQGLYDGSGKPPKSRPGGGCYDAHNPNDILGKSMDIDFQNSMLPSYVTEIRPEIENLPDVVYGKSIASTCLETGVNLARGANAMSYAMIMNDYESFDWHNRMFAAFSSHRAYWEKLAEISSATVAGGLPFYYSPHMWKRRLTQKEAPFSYEAEPVRNHVFLQTTGIPVTLHQSKGFCLLTGEVAECLCEEDITDLLKRNVIADGRAVSALKNKGFANELGVLCVPFESRAFRIEYTNHPANTACGGLKWKKSLCDGTWDFQIKDINEQAEVLSYYNTDSKEFTPSGQKYPYGIAEVLVKTALGGTWAILGYEPWSNIICTNRRNYILSLAKYLGDKVNCILHSPVQASLLPRLKNGRVYAVSIVNCEISHSGKLCLTVYNPNSLKPLYMDAQTTYIPEFTVNGNEITLMLNGINGWDLGTVMFE